jgi:hypothetical protein
MGLLIGWWCLRCLALASPWTGWQGRRPCGARRSIERLWGSPGPHLEPADDRLRLLLRPDKERLSSRAAKAGNELPPSSLNHLVGDREQGRRNGKAERLGRFGIDHQFKLSGAHDRKIGRLSALQDTAGVDADLTITFLNG